MATSVEILRRQREGIVDDGFLGLEEAKRKLQNYREELKRPLPPLESMQRAEASIRKLKELTQSMRGVAPPSRSDGSLIRTNGSSAYVGALPPPAAELDRDDPVLPADKGAFLMLLERHAFSEEEIKEKYERMEKQKSVQALHMSGVAVPLTGEAKHVIHAKTDPFQSNEAMIQKIGALTPRSLARQKFQLLPGNTDIQRVASTVSPVVSDDEDDESGGGKQPKNLRQLAQSLASSNADELIEKTIVLQQSKQDFQGNFGLKRAVQLAMAAQHAQQMDQMKRTFEQRLHEAVMSAKEHGLAIGRKEGTDASKALLAKQTQLITELQTKLSRLEAVAEKSYLLKEAQMAKVSFVREEKEKWMQLAYKYADVDLDDVMEKNRLYEDERKYLYAQAFRSAPDYLETILQRSHSPTHHGQHHGSHHSSPRVEDSPPHGSQSLNGSRGENRGKGSTASKGGPSAPHGGPSAAGRYSAAKAMLLHEALSRQVMALYDPMPATSSGGKR